jgi:transcriptional regulator with XRE-family HTH domain
MTNHDASVPTAVHESPGEAVQRLSRARAVSLEQVAFELGISFYSLRNRLNGRYPFRKLEAEKLAVLLSAPAETFLPKAGEEPTQ